MRPDPRAEDRRIELAEDARTPGPTRIEAEDGQVAGDRAERRAWAAGRCLT